MYRQSGHAKLITLYNRGNCYVHYVLSFTGQDSGSSPSTLELLPSSGQIPANGSQAVEVLFTPSSHNCYTFVVKCNAQSEDSALSLAPTIEVVGFGVYPKLAFVDARIDGIANSFVWKKFCLEEWNQALSSDLTEPEVPVF
jgi:hypothetical protein